MGELLLQDSGRFRSEEAVSFDKPHIREVVLPFYERARLRMGMVCRQNEALTSKLVLGVCAEAKKIWMLAHSEVKRTEMEDAVCFMLIAFRTGAQLMDGDARGRTR